MKHISTIIICLIIVFTLFFYKVENKQIINAGKSNWPGWDLFEYSQQKDSLFNSYKIKFINYPTYQSIVDAFIYNEVDIATLTLFEALIINNEIPNEFFIILLLDYTTGSDAIIAQKEIEFLHQLKNKTIGFEKNTVASFTLANALKKASINHNDIKFVEAPLNDLLAKFKEKKLDAISLYDPYIYELKQYNQRLNIIFSSKEIPRQICDVVIVRKSIVKKYPEIVNNIRANWYDLTKSALPFNKLSDALYYDANYIDHIKSNIYFANKNENNYAFGDKKNPGYLYQTIEKANQFLIKEKILSTQQNNIKDLLYK